MALPAISARSAAAASIWPRWRRSAWMRGSNGASEPLAASVDSAPVTSAARNSVSASNRRGERVGGRELRAVEQRQAFLRRRARAARGRRAPAPRRRARAVAVDEDLADADHGRRHVRQRREIARGADRALARHHRDQVRVASMRLEQRARSRGRTPEAPCARLASFSAIISRTTAAGIGSPTPAACDSTMLRCSVREIGRPRCARWRACRSRC